MRLIRGPEKRNQPPGRKKSILLSHGLCPTDPRMFYFSCKINCEHNGKTNHSTSVLYYEARISGDLLQVTAGLVRDRVESWPASPGVTVRGWRRRYLVASPTKRPPLDLIMTHFPSLFKELLQTQVHDMAFISLPIRSDEDRYVVS